MKCFLHITLVESILHSRAFTYAQNIRYLLYCARQYCEHCCRRCFVDSRPIPKTQAKDCAVLRTSLPFCSFAYLAFGAYRLDRDEMSLSKPSIP